MSNEQSGMAMQRDTFKATQCPNSSAAVIDRRYSSRFKTGHYRVVTSVDRTRLPS